MHHLTVSAEVETAKDISVEPRASAWKKPWVVAAVTCSSTYSLLQFLGFGQFRSEFLGMSLGLGIVGGVLLIAFRAFKGSAWLRWFGSFLLNWLFTAYAISFFAV